MVLVVGEGEQVGAISEREGCSQESRYIHIPNGHVVVGCAFVRRSMKETWGVRKSEEKGKEVEAGVRTDGVLGGVGGERGCWRGEVVY